MDLDTATLMYSPIPAIGAYDCLIVWNFGSINYYGASFLDQVNEL